MEKVDLDVDEVTSYTSNTESRRLYKKVKMESHLLNTRQRSNWTNIQKTALKFGLNINI